jgi:hypothetical protein
MSSLVVEQECRPLYGTQSGDKRKHLVPQIKSLSVQALCLLYILLLFSFKRGLIMMNRCRREVSRSPPRGVEDSALLVLTDVSGNPMVSMCNSQVVQEEQTFLISGYRCDVNEICPLMDFFVV